MDQVSGFAVDRKSCYWAAGEGGTLIFLGTGRAAEQDHFRYSDSGTGLHFCIVGPVTGSIFSFSTFALRKYDLNR